jgi:hypothetical protein
LLQLLQVDRIDILLTIDAQLRVEFDCVPHRRYVIDLSCII